VPLRINETYWACLSVDEPSTNLAWLSGWDGWGRDATDLSGCRMRILLAERAPPQPWQVTDPSGVGMSLRVSVTFSL
jgi:hypothetical protein